MDITKRWKKKQGNSAKILNFKVSYKDMQKLKY